MSQCPLPLPITPDPAINQLSALITFLQQFQQSPTLMAGSLFQVPAVKNVMPLAPPNDNKTYALLIRNKVLSWIEVKACP